ncbi:hypothetical protein B566_EDAN011829 [Ephemera danica]|nr:hypothetical protein B566_EDAN011829 [Ephemera danica]
MSLNIMQTEVNRPTFAEQVAATVNMLNVRSGIDRPKLVLNSDLEEVTEDRNESPDTTTTCKDFGKFGRCLGNHPPFLANSPISSFSKKFNFSDSKFNRTFNEALLNIRPNLEERFRKAPMEPVGTHLEQLINESICGREHSISHTTTLIAPQKSARPHEDEDRSSSVYSVPISKPEVHTMRVRIQHSPQAPIASTSNVVDSSNLDLEQWSVVPAKGKVLISGRNIKTRHNVITEPIARCISPRTLESSTGTLYHLMGAVCKNSKQLPVSIAEKFSNGFPANWKELLHTYTNKNIQDERPSTSGQSNSKEAIKRKRADAEDESENDLWLVPKERQGAKSFLPKSLVRTILEENDASEDECEDETNTEQPKIYKSLITGRISKTVTHKDSDSETSEQELKDSAAKLPKKLTRSQKAVSLLAEKERLRSSSRCSVVIKKLDEKDLHHSPKKKDSEGGKMLEERHVTPPIMNRISSTLLESDTGVQYILQQPSQMDTKNHGMSFIPKEISSKFVNGFPYNWLGVIKDWHLLLGLKIKLGTNKTTTVTKQVIKTVEVERTETVNTKKKKELSTGRKPQPLFINSKNLQKIKVTTSSRGRRIVQPLKYWENENMNKYSQILSPQNKANVKMEQVSHKTKATQKRKSPYMSPSRTEAKRTCPVSPKKQSQPQKKAVATKKAAGKIVKAKKIASPKAPSKAEPQKTDSKAAKPVKEKQFDKAEIREVLTQPLKGVRQRQKREKILQQMQKENAHIDNDFFTSGCSEMSSDDDVSETMWDADSVSSKLTTSDDDRMTYNYTPPGMRMNKLIAKVTPSPLKDNPLSPGCRKR